MKTPGQMKQHKIFSCVSSDNFFASAKLWWDFLESLTIARGENCVFFEHLPEKMARKHGRKLYTPFFFWGGGVNNSCF